MDILVSIGWGQSHLAALWIRIGAHCLCTRHRVTQKGEKSNSKIGSSVGAERLLK